ncbi:MAG: stage II sporulation protein R, partial [Defluviitaleaceae bacterium]|nr:stage II sporulation protein R [Defluviitaleaceae bacterium]
MKIARKEVKFVVAAVVAGVCFTFLFGWYTKAYSEGVQNGIAENVIRFHVLANSDTPDDQALKLKIRDAILDKLGPVLEASTSLDETKSYIQANLDEISAIGEAVAQENGYDYPVTAQLCVDYFPTKSYGDVTFPPGDYEALRVEIGAAQGHNWWCIMFPPLCYVDVTKNSGDQVPPASKAQ